jgi:hypothetical protein
MDAAKPGWGSGPKHNYTLEVCAVIRIPESSHSLIQTVRGFFLQDSEDTEDSTFDFVSAPAYGSHTH